MVALCWVEQMAKPALQTLFDLLSRFFYLAPAK
jgi:hypothetical protein